ncbi:MAG: type I 3-dehydroquinate dehydratase [Lachnospiraceae bacterium]|nr:type I 3-dehydroquinate dehydratase [Lachnospiraceae bacterium]
MKNCIEVRGLKIGEEIPKICLPITGSTAKEIIDTALSFKDVTHDLVEWRVDFYDDVFNSANLKDTLKSLREALGNVPLLFTFRTLNEGGEKSIDKDAYLSLNKSVIATGLVDLVDVELFIGDDVLTDIVDFAHSNNVKVVASNHDFNKTPAKDEIIYRLKKMQDLNADIPKIAVMPTCKRDVITLLDATEDFATNLADRPIITMSMKSDGVISRLCGEVFGSAVTFGFCGKASAPGQINAEDLKDVLQIIHQSQL